MTTDCLQGVAVEGDAGVLIPENPMTYDRKLKNAVSAAFHRLKVITCESLLWRLLGI